jgi:hypothetical protein
VKEINIHDLYRPFHKHFRAKRMRRFWRRFGLTPDTRVLDVGGYAFNWTLLPTFPRLTLLNLSLPTETHLSGCRQRHTWVVADGQHLPFKDKAFDIVYSNSVIEHLGDTMSQQAFAREIRRVGVCYYVQTPNRRFPVEPHLLVPLVHYLPRSLQKRLLRNFTVWGLMTRPSSQEVERFLQEVRLLDEREMQRLFPGAQIWHEHVLGLTKSPIAVKI